MKQIIVATVVLFIFLSGCKKDGPPCNSPDCFKIDSFSAQLKKRLDGKCIGYAYVIGYKGDVQAFDQGGYQRLPQDPPVEAFSPFSSMNPASLSKTITGIALCRALYNRSVPVMDSIYKFLPPDWVMGPNFKTITFEELLTHSSGIRLEPYADYPALRNIAAVGVQMSDKFNKYCNSNFDMMRILIPRLNSEYPTGTDADLSLEYSADYQRYVNDNLFLACSIPTSNCKPDAQDPSLCYQFPANGANGGDFGDWTLKCGQAGWNISPIYLSSLIRQFRYTEHIMPFNESKQMIDNLFAFDSKGTTPGFGVGWVQKAGGFPGGSNIGEFNGEIFLFDNDVSIVLYVNSQLSGTNVYQVILDAFDAAK